MMRALAIGLLLTFPLLPTRALAQDEPEGSLDELGKSESDPVKPPAPASRPARPATQPASRPARPAAPRPPRPADPPALEPSSQPPLVFARRPPLRFRNGKPAATLRLLQKAGYLAYAPNRTTHVFYWNTPTTIVRKAGKLSLPADKNVVKVAFSRDSRRVALCGSTVEPIFSVYELASGTALTSWRGYVEDAAFVGGDGRKLAYAVKSDGIRIYRLDDPFTGAPRLIADLALEEASFSSDGKRALAWGRGEAIALVSLEGDGVQHLRVPGAKGALKVAPDASRVCFADPGGEGTRCLRLADRRLEQLPGCAEPRRFDAAGKKLLLACRDGHALVDFARRTLTPLAGVRPPKGGGVDLSAGGTAVARGSDRFFEYFDLRRRVRQYVSGPGGLWAVNPVPGLPHAIAVGGENDTEYDLYLYAPR